MRYLKYSSQYKLEKNNQNQKLNEAVSDGFGNDITWGGSLLGRLINSSLRKINIGYNYRKVDNLVKGFNQELDSLLEEVSLNVDQKKKVKNLLFRRILENIYLESISDQDIDEKLDILLGSHTTEGLIDQVVIELKTVEVENKQDLIDKLTNFKNDLIKIKQEDYTEKKSVNMNENFYKNSKKLINDLLIINLDIKDNKVKFNVKVSDTLGVKVPTFFNEEEYKNQKSNTYQEVSNKLSQAKKAVTIFTNKNDKVKTDFYNKEVQNLTKRLNGFQKNSSIRPENESLIYENVDESIEKIVWKKIVNAYNTSGISKFSQNLQSLLKASDQSLPEGERKIVYNRIVDIGKQVIINLDNVGKPISYQELVKERKDYLVSINDVSKSISLFNRYLLPLKEKMDVLQKFGEVGEHIKEYINCFYELKNLYSNKETHEQNELIVLDYSSFSLIKESDDDVEKNLDDEGHTDVKKDEFEGDSVKKSWFRFFSKGDEEKWKITKDDEKLREDVEKEGDEEHTLENAQNDDHIIKIVNLFGRAYRLYATDYIPSGRPGGIVSQKTLREYEYLGKDTPRSSTSGSGIDPGPGPWASKSIFNKWQDGITKILEDKKYRKILANIKFISEAESSTGTPMKYTEGGKLKSGGSGKNLFTFINDMLSTEGSFKQHRKYVFEKYFGVKGSHSGKEEIDIDTPRYDPTISKENQGDTNDPFFSNAVDTFRTKNLKLVSLKEKIIKVTNDNGIYIIYPYNVDKNGEWVLFKYQVSEKNKPKQSIITDSLKEQKDKDLKIESIEDSDLHGVPYKSGMKYNVGFAVIKNNTFTVGNKFVFKYLSLDNIHEVKDFTIKINRIDYLVIPTNFKDRKGVSRQQ